MDAVLLRGVGGRIIADYDTSAVVPKLTALESAFAASVQSPSPETATKYEAARTALIEAVQGMSTTKLTAAEMSMLENVHGIDLVGQGLIARVDQVLTAGVSPATIVEGLRSLRERMAAFRAALETLDNGLKALNISEPPPATTATAAAEITLPEKLFEDSLGGLARESKRLNESLLVLVEAATGSRPPLEIEAVSTGSLIFILNVGPSSGLLILQVTAAILTVIANMLNLKKTYLELQKQNAPPAVQQEIAQWHKQQTDAAVDKIRDDVLAAIEDAPRRIELKSSTHTAVTYLADRMDKGMRVNVDVKSPAGEAVDPVVAELQELRQQVIALSSDLKRLSPPEPVLGLLPAAADAEEDRAAANPPIAAA